MSISEASEIVAGCKRLEKENWRRAHWELQNRFCAMQLDSTLAATARPFIPQAMLQSSREDNAPQAYPTRSGWVLVERDDPWAVKEVAFTLHDPSSYNCAVFMSCICTKFK